MLVFHDCFHCERYYYVSLLPPSVIPVACSAANEDSERIAALIKKHMHDLDEIYVTLDSHHVSIYCFTSRCDII